MKSREEITNLMAGCLDGLSDKAIKELPPELISATTVHNCLILETLLDIRELLIDQNKTKGEK